MVNLSGYVKSEEITCVKEVFYKRRWISDATFRRLIKTKDLENADLGMR